MTKQVREGAKSAPVGGFLDRKRTERLKWVAEDHPAALGLFRRVYEHKTSPRDCVKAFCLECSWMDVFAIRECRASACPLWHIRPFQKKG